MEKFTESQYIKKYKDGYGLNVDQKRDIDYNVVTTTSVQWKFFYWPIVLVYIKDGKKSSK